jgi:hypothetical protein
MGTSKIVCAALTAASSLSAGLAQARGAIDVQQQITTSSPVALFPVPRVAVMPAPLYGPPPPRCEAVEPPYAICAATHAAEAAA